jgi:flagellar hook-associated protein 2
MRTALAKSYTINGKSYSLASFGISTQSYLSAAKTEKNMYHIDGDSDDALTKTKDDKLLKAIAENPDDVAEFFSQLVKGTYEALDAKMKSSSMSSAYVVYNDKQITKDLTDYKDKIKKWEDKVKYYEDFYYKKFSGMEKALAQLQSSQNSLSMLLGQ